MNVEEFGVDIEMEIEAGPDIFTLISAELQPAEGDVSEPNADATEADGDKAKEVVVRRNRK